MQTFKEMVYGGASRIYWGTVLYVERCLSFFVSRLIVHTMASQHEARGPHPE